MRLCLVLLSLLAVAAQAEEPLLRPSASLLFKQPELLRPGQCVRYREGGEGWVLREPSFYVRGRVVRAEVASRRLARCPAVDGKQPTQYTRSEFVRWAAAQPCVVEGGGEGRDVQVGIVRLSVDDWETPHAANFANRGRLFRGHYLDHPLVKGGEIEVEANLLEPCES